MTREKVLDDVKKRLDKIEELNKKGCWKVDKLDKIIAYKFAKELTTTFSGFVHAVVLFGSVGRYETDKDSDIDILVLVDDVTVPTINEIMASYRLGVIEIQSKLTGGNKIHVNTIKLTTFWDGVRQGDPVIMNMIRFGIPLIDTGFFNPIKALLEDGRIRPSKEAIEAHTKRAIGILRRADDQIAIAVDNLYWAAIDAAHAALMSEGKPPETPGQIPALLEKEFYGKNKPLDKEDIEAFKGIYKLMKEITHRKIHFVRGKTYDNHRKPIHTFVEKMAKIVEKNEGKKLI